MSIRPVHSITQAKPTMEGAGVHLHRAFGFGAHYTTLVRFGLIWRHGSIAVMGSVRNSLRI